MKKSILMIFTVLLCLNLSATIGCEEASYIKNQLYYIDLVNTVEVKDNNLIFRNESADYENDYITEKFSFLKLTIRVQHF